MPRFEITAPDGKVFDVDGPDGSTAEQALAQVQAQYKPRSRIDRFDDTMKGASEAGLTLLSGATTGLLGRLGGTIGGIAGSIGAGKFGTQEGAAMAAQSAEEGAQRLTYKPQSPEAIDQLQSISRLFDDSKLAGLGPSAPTVASSMGRPAVGTAARMAQQDARGAVSPIVKRAFAKDIPDEALPGSMVGVGSAETETAAMRRAAAEELPIPIKLTKGQAERTFQQQQFERETAKNPKLGEPLRQRFADQNEKILQNFDAWLDQTGAEAGSARAAGETVSNAIAAKADRAKGEIKAAYGKARDAGELQARLDTAPLQKYIEDHRAEAINAPVLASVEAKLGSIAQDGKASINDLEEVRKMVGRLSGKDATNALFGKEVKGVIDGMTEGAGGELYKRARTLRTRYGQEFEDHAVIDKLLSFKPGTKDRAVAYEDVFSHSILKGSLDDVKTVRKTLQTSGPEGKQAWSELQGATIQHIKDEITKNVQVDAAGNRVISPARLDKIVTELDKDGKLDFVFGKQGAEKIRNVNNVAQHAFTAPPGAVNTSNTTSAMLTVLDKIASRTTGVPFLGSAAGYASREVRDAKARKQVQQALE